MKQRVKALGLGLVLAVIIVTICTGLGLAVLALPVLGFLKPDFFGFDDLEECD